MSVVTVNMFVSFDDDGYLQRHHSWKWVTNYCIVKVQATVSFRAVAASLGFTVVVDYFFI